MSQILQVHINQRMLKTEPSDNNPSSPIMANSATLSPLTMGPSSPQGMPIPKREPSQHWIANPNMLATANNPTTWNGFSLNVNQADLSYDLAMDALEVPNIGPDMDSMSMEGELSKLSMAVDDDDIFKTENTYLLGPTLAELNAPDADTLLDGLNFDDLYWPPDSTVAPLEATPSPQTPAGGNPIDPDHDVMFQQVQQSSSFPTLTNVKILPAPGTSVPVVSTILEQNLMQPALTLTSELPTYVNAVVNNANTINQQSSSGGLRELLLRRDLQNSLESPDPSPLGQSLPRSMLSPSPGPGSPRLSSSAPTGQGNAWETWQQRREAVWSRRDPRPHLLSTGSLAEGGSTSSISGVNSFPDVLSPGREFSLSMDEGFDSDDVSDRDSSDEESEVSDTESNAGSTPGSRRERYFWQYNVQAKGPKGQRLVLAPTQEDPHVLQRPTDPVFSPLCHIQGIKHSGKARKGDGNDLTPNPRKLWSIGKELDRLNKVIAEMTPVADVPNAVKSRSRKEKNKLASRACRLKKKAQHEANKLKLYGLEQEHKRLISAIDRARQLIFAELDGTVEPSTEPLAVRVEKISKQGTTGQKVGGHTTEFVNKVLEKVNLGVPDGGINEI